MEKQAYVLTVLLDGSPKGPSVCLFFSLILMEQPKPHSLRLQTPYIFFVTRGLSVSPGVLGIPCPLQIYCLQYFWQDHWGSLATLTHWELASPLSAQILQLVCEENWALWEEWLWECAYTLQTEGFTSLQEFLSTSINSTSKATVIRKSSLCLTVTQLYFIQFLGTDVAHSWWLKIYMCNIAYI